MKPLAIQNYLTIHLWKNLYILGIAVGNSNRERAKRKTDCGGNIFHP